MTIPQIAELTWKQIGTIYFAKRDEHGNIVLPSEETPADDDSTFEGQLALVMGSLGLVSNPLEFVAQLYAKHGKEIPADLLDSLKPKEEKVHQRPRPKHWK